MSVHPRIRALGRALPQHHADQETLIAALRELWARRHHNVARFEELQRAVRVDQRYLALPISAYRELDSFGKANDAWIVAAQELGERALRDALGRARLDAREIQHLFFVTVTGIATPSIDAHLANRLRLRADLKRTPIFGLGCVAGAGGIARAADALRAYPDQVAALLSVELCSLTLQRDDLSVANAIASGLFGDGAAAVILEGGARAGGSGPRVLATRSVLYPDSEDVMGWEVVDTGFQVRLSARVPQMVLDHLGRDVDAFLGASGLARKDIRHWIAHTGGPKVLEAFHTALDLPAGALDRSWRSLAQVGNLSSASVLFVLADLEEEGAARPGDLGVLAAMGPGFCAELVLLQW